MFFRKKAEKRSFNDVLTILGAQKFDVSPAKEATAGAFRVSKYGCAAEIAPTPVIKPQKGIIPAPAEIIVRPGVLLNGQIAHILDRGYQKFIKTPRLEIAATADHLRSLHKFEEELREATGALSLYNQSLGTTSDEYLYDRVKGREPGTAVSESSGRRTADPLQRSSSVAVTSEDDANDL